MMVQNRVRHLGATICAAIAFVAVTRIARAQLPMYSVINLGAPYNPVTATSLNDDYEIVGNQTNGGNRYGFFWAPGIPAVQLPFATTANGINNLGDVAGSQFFTNSSANAASVFFPNAPYTSSYSYYGINAGASLEALTGITDDGFASGYINNNMPATAVFSTIGDTITSYSWRSADVGETLGAVPVLGSTVGYLGSANTRSAEVFTANVISPTALTLPSGISNPSVVNAVDGAFDMVGFGTGGPASAPVPLFFYLGATAAVPLALPKNAVTGQALAVNGTAGMIGGSCSLLATLWQGDLTYPAFIAAINANTLVGPHSQWHLQTVTSINDDGAFVGTGLYGQKPVAYLAIPVTLTSIATDVSTIKGGTDTLGTVTISAPAPFDMTIQLASFSSAVKFSNGYYTATVVISAGDTQATFPVDTTAVTSNQRATIRANYGGWDVYDRLLVTP